MKRGLYFAPFDDLADPRVLANLASRAEARGWDGIFLWDRIAYPPPGRAVADPWVALSAIACATERVRLGPMVTALSRRRVQKVARETVTLDHLSDGRLVFGVGLGNDDDFELFGEVVDRRERAQLLDEGLERLVEYWSGAFQPLPVQRPRIPIWVAAKWPNRRPVQRAIRWDGLFPIELPGPGALAELAREIETKRPDDHGNFDLVVDLPPGSEIDRWEDAGATWILTALDPDSQEHDVVEVIDDLLP